MERSLHPIRRYCRAHGITLASFAKSCGLSASFVHRVSSGERKTWIPPGREATKAIIKTACGELGALELWEFHPWESRESTNVRGEGGNARLSRQPEAKG